MTTNQHLGRTAGRARPVASVSWRSPFALGCGTTGVVSLPPYVQAYTATETVDTISGYGAVHMAGNTNAMATKPPARHLGTRST